MSDMQVDSTQGANADRESLVDSLVEIHGEWQRLAIQRWLSERYPSSETDVSSMDFRFLSAQYRTWLSKQPSRAQTGDYRSPGEIRQQLLDRYPQDAGLIIPFIQAYYSTGSIEPNTSETIDELFQNFRTEVSRNPNFLPRVQRTFEQYVDRVGAGVGTAVGVLTPLGFTPTTLSERIRIGRQMISDLIHGARLSNMAEGLGLAPNAQFDEIIDLGTGETPPALNPNLQLAWNQFRYGDVGETSMAGIAGGQMAGRYRGPSLSPTQDPLTLLIGVSRSKAMEIIRSLDDDDFLALQHRFYQAGLYDQRPIFGYRGMAEHDALDRLVEQTFRYGPGYTLTELVDSLTEENMRAQALMTQGDMSVADWLTDIPEEPDVISTVPIESYERIVTDVAQSLLGMDLDPAATRAMAAQLRDKDVVTQRRNNQLASYAAEARTPIGDRELDAFLQALSEVESNGNYQSSSSPNSYGKYGFNPAMWSQLAAQAGLTPSADITDEWNQDYVARFLATNLHRQYGNWADVASGWNTLVKRNSGTNTVRGINNYSSTLLARQQNYLRQGLQETELRMNQAIDPVTGEVFVEEFDPTSEVQRALRASRAPDIFTHSFGKQAQQFFSLLGGVV